MCFSLQFLISIYCSFNLRYSYHHAIWDIYCSDQYIKTNEQWWKGCEAQRGGARWHVCPLSLQTSSFLCFLSPQGLSLSLSLWIWNWNGNLHMVMVIGAVTGWIGAEIVGSSWDLPSNETTRYFNTHMCAHIHIQFFEDYGYFYITILVLTREKEIQYIVFSFLSKMKCGWKIMYN